MTRGPGPGGASPARSVSHSADVSREDIWERTWGSTAEKVTLRDWGLSRPHLPAFRWQKQVCGAGGREVPPVRAAVPL